MVPFAIEALALLIVIDRSVAAVTVSAIAFEVIPPCVAVMLLVPADNPLATPPGLIPATAGFDEVQITELVTSCDVPSLKIAVAVN